MSADPQTTEQSKEEWVLAHFINKTDFKWRRIGVTKLVRVHGEEEFRLDTDDVRVAMRDPANVLNISAYPEVVEAAEQAMRIWPAHFRGSRLKVALSHVHPAAELDKT